MPDPCGDSPGEKGKEMTAKRETEIRSRYTGATYHPATEPYAGAVKELLVEIGRLRELCRRAAESMRESTHQVDQCGDWTGHYYDDELINELDAAKGGAE